MILPSCWMLRVANSTCRVEAWVGRMAVMLMCNRSEAHPYRRLGVKVEFVARETAEKVGLADTRVPDDYHCSARTLQVVKLLWGCWQCARRTLKEVIIIIIGPRCSPSHVSVSMSRRIRSARSAEVHFQQTCPSPPLLRTALLQISALPRDKEQLWGHTQRPTMMCGSSAVGIRGNAAAVHQIHMTEKRARYSQQQRSQHRQHKKLSRSALTSCLTCREQGGLRQNRNTQDTCSAHTSRRLRWRRLFTGEALGLSGGLWYPYPTYGCAAHCLVGYSCIYVREVAEYVGIG